MQKARLIQVGKKGQNLAQRLAVLEKRVAKLEGHNRLALFQGDLTPPNIARKKPGPTPKLTDYQLTHRRDMVFSFLGHSWPEVRVLLRRARSADRLRSEATARYANEREWSEAGRAFVKGIDALWGYFKSYRYSDDPEQIANAMAGHPELAWRTSLNRCQRNPTRISLGLRAWRLYLKRKNPDLLKSLEAAKSTEEVRCVLSKTRSNDEVILGLKRNPELAKEWLLSGRPSLS